jgi:2-polyprenyl-3-methyl-5-hydroxy-6-metoxy-1,4-benzoquinol methylase
MSSYREWDEFYRDYPLDELGWELGKPRPILVEYLEKGLLPKGRALDVCCGAGTNTVYLAQNRWEVTAIDISKTAIGITKQKAKQAKVNIGFLAESFIDLPFLDGVFDFVWDMGCFHHVEIEERSKFIAGVHRVLKENGGYMLTAFSYRNGSGWNQFTEQQLRALFGGYFEFGEFRHYPSLEGDGAIRFFYTVLMKKKQV